MFRKYAFAALAVAALTVPARADGTLVLKDSQGYDFTKASVTKTGDRNADISFTGGKKAALAATKIKGFGPSVPPAAAFNDMKSWTGSVDAPAPGYYAVEGRDHRTVYLLQVTNVADQGKSTEITAYWEKLW